MLKKINAWFHLWVGIITGIPVVIISITGCVLVFEQDVNALFQSWRSVEHQVGQKMLPPSIIYATLKKTMPGVDVHGFWYEGLDKPVKVTIDSDSILYVNPYTAAQLAFIDHEDFFHFVEEGHLYLWMPPKIGRQVVSWCTAVFFLLLLTGLILWFPVKWNSKTVEKSFKVKWNAKFKRLNYDLHNVLGFYSLLLAVLMAVTGLIMGFPLVRQSVYWLSGGTAEKDTKVEVTEILPAFDGNLMQKVDAVWEKVRTEYGEKNKDAVIIHFPEEAGEAIYACTDMYNGNWRDLYFDQETLSLLPSSRPKIGDLNTADWIMRSNYALHTGLIGGLITKILYFLASLICASLPVTGFLIWYHRTFRKKKKNHVSSRPVSKSGPKAISTNVLP